MSSTPLFKTLIDERLPSWIKYLLRRDAKLISEGEYHYGIRIEPARGITEEWDERQSVPLDMREDLKGWDTGHSYDS